MFETDAAEISELFYSILLAVRAYELTLKKQYIA